MRAYLFGLLGGLTAIVLVFVLLVGAAMVRGAKVSATPTPAYQFLPPAYVMPVRTVEMNPRPIPQLTLPTAQPGSHLQQDRDCQSMGYSGSNYPNLGCHP